MKFWQGAVLVIALVTISQLVESVRPVNGGNQIVTLGTFAAADVTCLTKKIFKFQSDPQTINFISTTAINWIRVTQLSQYGVRSGISASVVGGALATEMVTLSVEDTGNKSFFQSDVLVEMRCAP